MADEEKINTEKTPLVDGKPAQDRTRLLIISFLLMVVIGLGNKVFQKLETYPMYNYPYFLNMLTTFVYIPLSFLYIWPVIKWGTAISQEQRDIPTYKFGIMGFLDGIAGLLQSFAVNYIPSGPLIILLYQSAIPISMAISKPLMKAKYQLQHYLGAGIVVGGLLVVLIPLFLDPSGSSSSSHESSGTVLIWCAVLVFSCVPMTLSSVYKEKNLNDVEIDVVYLNGWVAIYQFITCAALAVPAGYASGLTPSEIPKNFADGAKCYIGLNTITTGNNPDNCELVGPLFVTLYLCFNVAYNILIIMILKYGSSNILWLAMTLMVPLGSVFFTIPVPYLSQKLRPTDIVGLFVILGGLIIYRFWDMLIKLVNKITGKKR